jgi:hypothetical protein
MDQHFDEWALATLLRRRDQASCFGAAAGSRSEPVAGCLPNYVWQKHLSPKLTAPLEINQGRKEVNLPSDFPIWVKQVAQPLREGVGRGRHRPAWPRL